VKNILILGVSGFIGSNLSRRILETTDWHVYGMDMFTTKVEDLLGHKRFHFFEGDITINKEWVEYHVRKCDVVLPLVAVATPAVYVQDPLRVFELDFEANLPIVRHCVKYRKARAVSVPPPRCTACAAIPVSIHIRRNSFSARFPCSAGFIPVPNNSWTA